MPVTITSVKEVTPELIKKSKILEKEVAGNRKAE